MESIRIDGNQEDFQSYIDTEMDIAVEGSYRDKVAASLLERSQGNFLWIHLAVQRINSCHTKFDVEQALGQLPAGMEALYDRMADSVQSQTNSSDRRLGLNILGWALCARRVLSVEELSDALDNNDLLEIHRTIGDLCGGFVVVDVEGKVSMIHETAREYLVREGRHGHSFTIPRKPTNDKLLARCLQCLTDPKLRARIIRNEHPPLLRYAARSWFVHLSLGSFLEPVTLKVVLKFLQGPLVLTWIHVAAMYGELRTLVVASRYLTEVLIKLRKLEDQTLEHTQAVDVLERWATDLTKIVGKFGHGLTQTPDAIHKLIPPFCPESSIIYQQFGRKESKALCVSDSTSKTWDDCLTSLAVDQGAVATTILPAGNHIVVLFTIKMTSYIIVHDASTFEETRRIKHPERVLKIAVNKLGSLVVSYGYLTTRLWEISTGKCVEVIKNPVRRPRPHTLVFAEEDSVVLTASEDRCIRSFALGEEASEWDFRDQIEEEALDDTNTNLPTCSKLSPDGTMIAFGYRAHPVTVWELEPLMLVGQCNVVLDETNMMNQTTTWGEVIDLDWHPFSGDVFGVTLVGLLFRWNPFEDEPAAQTQAGTDRLVLSSDGSLIASGDGLGTIKIYQSSDLMQLYQLSTQDPIVSLAFSVDSRRIYDSRGAYSNIWEPNILARLAEKSEYSDHNSDSMSDTESLARVSVHTEQYLSTTDSVIALSGQPVGPLYCYGTEDGVVVMSEIGKGKLEVTMRPHMRYMSIEQVSWSEDGKYLATSDLSGMLSVTKWFRSAEDRSMWACSDVLNVVIPPHEGHISQLLFNPAGDQIVAATADTLYAINLATKNEAQSNLAQHEDASISWVCHPTLSEYLLGFGATKLHILAWKDLRRIDTYAYFPSRELDPPAEEHGHHSSMKSRQASVTRLITNVDLSNILLKLTSPGSSTRPQHEYLLFEVADILPNIAESPKEDHKILPYTLLPSEVATRIREPLAFLSRRRLLYLDIDRWICTWRLPPSATARGSLGTQGLSARKRGSESASGGIERHYMLPRDWLATREARLCCSMPDGTILCPRNGDVATVQCAKLKK